MGSRDFIWIDESYDQQDFTEGKFYILGAIKIKASPEEIMSYKINPSGFVHKGIYTSYKNTRSKVTDVNKNRKEKKKIRISELHEYELISNDNNRVVKGWFLKQIVSCCPSIEIYYVYYNSKDLNVSNELERYKMLSKELLDMITLSENSHVTLDICLDNHGNIDQREEIKNYLHENCNISDKDQIEFADSQGNCGLQAVDNIIGTIRRKFHNMKYDQKNYELVSEFIKGYKKLDSICLYEKKLANIS